MQHVRLLQIMEESTPILELDRGAKPHVSRDCDPPFTPVKYSSAKRKRKIMSTARRFNQLTLEDSDSCPATYYSSPEDAPALTSTLIEELGCPKAKKSRISSPGGSTSAPNSPAIVFTGFTPTKKYVCPQKVNTPERFRILYPNLKEVKTPSKPKTPQKLREMLVEAPAKKKLFKETYDPLQFFRVDSNNPEIVQQIFGYLSEKDLLAAQRVSKLWKREIAQNSLLKQKIRIFVNHIQTNKENSTECGKTPDSPERSPPPSPNSVNHVRWQKAAEKLEPREELKKCFKCSHPAVKRVDSFVCRCLNCNCGIFFCSLCLSYAFKPEEFHDQCHHSEISPLSDLSNGNVTTTPILLLSPSSSGPAFDNSSGYFSMSDSSATATAKSVSSKVLQKPLKAHNSINSTPVRRSSTLGKHLSAVSTVTPQSRLLQREKSTSPKPKLTTIGSKKSRMNLRRLFK